MKTLTQHITERLQLNKNRVQNNNYEYFPKDKYELARIINYISKNLSKKQKKCKVIDLNMIDVSNIDNMSELFAYSSKQFDISKWDVSHVKDMSYMFAHSKFNQDISKWNVSHVDNMSHMFFNSDFNQDISQWNVLGTDTSDMFTNCPLEANPPAWYT